MTANGLDEAFAIYLRHRVVGFWCGLALLTLAGYLILRVSRSSVQLDPEFASDDPFASTATASAAATAAATAGVIQRRRRRRRSSSLTRCTSPPETRYGWPGQSPPTPPPSASGAAGAAAAAPWATAPTAKRSPASPPAAPQSDDRLAELRLDQDVPVVSATTPPRSLRRRLRDASRSLTATVSAPPASATASAAASASATPAQPLGLRRRASFLTFASLGDGDSPPDLDGDGDAGPLGTSYDESPLGLNLRSWTSTFHIISPSRLASRYQSLYGISPGALTGHGPPSGSPDWHARQAAAASAPSMAAGTPDHSGGISSTATTPPLTALLTGARKRTTPLANVETDYDPPHITHFSTVQLFCIVTLATSLGSFCLLPLTLIVQAWPHLVNPELLESLWFYNTRFSELSFFVLLPWSYFFAEAAESDMRWWRRARESLLTLTAIWGLLAILLLLVHVTFDMALTLNQIVRVLLYLIAFPTHVFLLMEIPRGTLFFLAKARGLLLLDQGRWETYLYELEFEGEELRNQMSQLSGGPLAGRSPSMYPLSGRRRSVQLHPSPKLYPPLGATPRSISTGSVALAGDSPAPATVPARASASASGHPHAQRSTADARRAALRAAIAQNTDQRRRIARSLRALRPLYSRSLALVLYSVLLVGGGFLIFKSLMSILAALRLLDGHPRLARLAALQTPPPPAPVGAAAAAPFTPSMPFLPFFAIPALAPKPPPPSMPPITPVVYSLLGPGPLPYAPGAAMPASPYYQPFPLAASIINIGGCVFILITATARSFFIFFDHRTDPTIRRVLSKLFLLSLTSMSLPLTSQILDLATADWLPYPELADTLFNNWTAHLFRLVLLGHFVVMMRNAFLTIRGWFRSLHQPIELTDAADPHAAAAGSAAATRGGDPSPFSLDQADLVM
ncbi:hypothetical protein CXG81DRAFT_24204 [Caulochytrium protostelioides]|uniref:Uncharacterized protein n=1 Tax=Caulochytrium protostelioides TaxID=1555241 RepID=A0A4P9XCP3_9FUNG|nr:hypothetical protein CXG81DRAFT_24204 [Caulochytrium protostelioides]|eukprot:RKP03203.1 hypothetical protein CXG81DRAFT_24204 [Caulochytrium protostelioides]